MAHIHEIVDADAHFKIDGVYRTVINLDETKRELVQYDHKSERITFEIPRFVDGHDFADCNATQIHYENKDALEKNVSADIYDVKDLRVKADDEDTVVLSWLVEDTATQYVGTLGFSIRFCCIVDGVLEYAWGTKWFDGITIVQGCCLSAKVEKEHPDVIANLSATQKELADKIEDIMEDVNEQIESIELPGVTNMYVCSGTEVRGISHAPNIAKPDEETVYLVPQDDDGAQYKSWVYADGAWKFVEELTVTFDETEGGNGLSAYEVAVKNGFNGSEQEWLESLKGEDGRGIVSFTHAGGFTQGDGNRGTMYKLSYTDGTSTTISVYNGKTPVKGEDYFTDADKTAMVQAVIAALPKYAGEVITV